MLPGIVVGTGDVAGQNSQKPLNSWSSRTSGTDRKRIKLIIHRQHAR